MEGGEGGREHGRDKMFLDRTKSLIVFSHSSNRSLESHGQLQAERHLANDGPEGLQVLRIKTRVMYRLTPPHPVPVSRYRGI